MSLDTTSDTETWKEKWRAVEALVGQDLSDGEISWGIDVIEPAIVRRYAEPLEIDSPIHYDVEAAQAPGLRTWSDISCVVRGGF